MPGGVLAATGAALRRSARKHGGIDGGVVGPDVCCSGRYVLTARAAVARQRHRSSVRRSPSSAIVTTPRLPKWRSVERRPPDVGRRARQSRCDAHTAIAICRSSTTRSPMPGVFAQDDRGRDTGGCRSRRADDWIIHSEYGTFFSPRVVGARARRRMDEPALRSEPASSARRRLTEETEAAGLTPCRSSDARCRRARPQRVDRYQPRPPARNVFGHVLRSRVDAMRSTSSARRGCVLTNAVDTDDERRRRSRRHACGARPFALTATYTYVRSRETGGRSVLADGRRSRRGTARASSECGSARACRALWASSGTHRRAAPRRAIPHRAGQRALRDPRCGWPSARFGDSACSSTARISPACGGRRSIRSFARRAPWMAGGRGRRVGAARRTERLERRDPGLRF